jgi:hypothetical protein
MALAQSLLRFVLSHLSDKNKNVAKMGHPALVRDLLRLVLSHFCGNSKYGAKMGHPADVSRSRKDESRSFDCAALRSG